MRQRARVTRRPPAGEPSAQGRTSRQSTSRPVCAPACRGQGWAPERAVHALQKERRGNAFCQGAHLGTEADVCMPAWMHLLHSRTAFMYACLRKQLSLRQPWMLRRVGQSKIQSTWRVEQGKCQAWDTMKPPERELAVTQAAPLLHPWPHLGELHISSQTEDHTCASLPAAHFLEAMHIRHRSAHISSPPVRPAIPSPREMVSSSAR